MLKPYSLPQKQSGPIGLNMDPVLTLLVKVAFALAAGAFVVYTLEPILTRLAPNLLSRGAIRRLRWGLGIGVSLLVGVLVF